MTVHIWHPGDFVRPCGDETGRCNYCCRWPEIPELHKPAGAWCQHCEKAKGCKIHAERPDGCKAFQCLWSVSPDLPEEMRPDKCKVMFSMSDECTILAQTDYPDKMETAAMRGLVEKFWLIGVRVVVVGRHGKVRFPP